VLHPWWVVQGAVPYGIRRILSFVVPMIIGYWIGQRALGWEWAATLLSMASGTVVAFLLLFTPPSPTGRA
jgi:hypothetical protein